MLTFRNIDVNCIRFRIGSSASVVARVAVCGVVDNEATVGLGARLRGYRDASPRCVVVDHVLVVVPEHVLRWGRALQPATHRKSQPRVLSCGTRTRTEVGYYSAASNTSKIRAAGIELWYQNTYCGWVGLCNQQHIENHSHMY